MGDFKPTTDVSEQVLGLVSASTAPSEVNATMLVASTPVAGVSSDIVIPAEFAQGAAEIGSGALGADFAYADEAQRPELNSFRFVPATFDGP